MTNQQIASSLSVEVDGVELRPSVSVLLTCAYVDDSRLLPDMFVLRFRDADATVLDESGMRIGSQLRLCARTSDVPAPQLLVAGEITALSTEIDGGGSVLEVRGYDHAHRLMRGRRVASYADMAVADVVRTVAQRAGLKVGRIDPGGPPAPDSQLTQDNVSDWDFLQRLADASGTEVAVVDRTLSFRRPTASGGAPGVTTRARRSAHVLEAGQNLTVLHATVSAADQVEQVEVRSWDPLTKQAITATAQATTAVAEVAGPTPGSLAGEFGDPTMLATDVPYRSRDAAQTAATSLAAQVAGGFAELDGVARGNPGLRAGSAVTLANVGRPFEGRYTLTSTRHLFSEDVGYATSFTASGAQERSLYGLTNGPRPRSGAPALAPALVSDVRDPRGLGRVKVTYPWLGDDYCSGWARTVQIGAGKDRGAMVLPEVGDEVLVGFEHGDLDCPYVLGGLYNGQDTPARADYELVDGTTGQVGGRRLVSRTGHRLDMVETRTGADAVQLATGDGHHLLDLDRKAAKVTLRSDGTVLVQAARGITIDAGSGSLELKGRDVSIEATAGASLKGATASVTGRASAELKADAVVTIAGTPIRIN